MQCINMKNKLIVKGWLNWVPYIVVLGVFYGLGSTLYHMFHPALFLLAIIPGISVLLVFTMRFLLREDNIK